MTRPGLFIKLLVLPLVAFWSGIGQSTAAHIIGGDIFWECLPSGEFKFYLTLYKDCTVNTPLENEDALEVWNDTVWLATIDIVRISQTDISEATCGITCSAASAGDVAIEQHIYASDPVTLNAVPSVNGLTITYHRCCRNPVDNLVSADQAEIYYRATMYPYNGQNINPCYDSSPQFAELPTALMCSGYSLRYNSNATDTNLDSLSYSFAPALAAGATPISYQPGYSPTTPLPGPNQVTLNPVTGQMDYDSPSGIQGRWTVVTEVNGWRCGQLVSSNTREMSVAILPCSETNDIPQVAPPAWSSPGTATGFEVTVDAGDLVSFDLSATDNDLTGGNPQIMEFTASGNQFDQSVTGQTGCIAPCATLSNVTPPASGQGTIATTFSWQTTCDHIATHQECATLSSTYNFLFKYKDDFCPAPGINFVNVAITVVGEDIVESPVPHCASTNADGSITLYWETVVDNSNPPSFVEYVILHSTSPSGPFDTEVGTVTDINTGTWTHSIANPNPPTTSGPNFYVIRTRSGCGGQQLEAPVDTISSIYLTMTDNGATVDLAWTPVATPPLPSSNGGGLGWYQLYREEPTVPWSLLSPPSPTTDLFYTDPVIWCNDSVSYRVELTDNLTCTSVSNVVGQVLSNADDPDPQEIDSVTVENELARISWSPNPQTNVIEYTVEQNNGGIWTPLTTLSGYTNTDWTNPMSSASTVSELYRVKAANNCLIPGEPGLFHRTILASVIGDGCGRRTTVSWSPYINWPEGVDKYEIYASQDGSAETKVGTVADTIFQFVHEDLIGEATYCYRVAAVRKTATRITSTSNDTCVYLYIPKRPEYGYNYNTTVQPGNTGVEEYFFTDSTAGYLGFEIQRGTEPDALSYQWFLPFDPSTRFYSYTDAGARPAFNSYYYSVVGVDSCDQYADTLNMSRTMLLEAEANPDRTNSLQWNAYEGWNGGVTAYNIFRKIDGPFEYLTTVPPSQLTYLDTIQEIIIGEGNFCYYIEAVEGIGDPVGPVVAPPEPVPFMETSRSNEDCARQHPNVFMPNAFMPEGVNNVFKPVTVYVQADSYLFQIYNRWGQRIFETNDPNEGWNGSHGGKEDPQGAYVYFVSFVSSSGDTYTKSGSVTLIR